MCESFPDCDPVSSGKSEFRPSLKYLLTGWRMRKSFSNSPFNDSQERKLCKMIFDSWKSENYLTTEQFQLAAYSLAKANNLKIHPSWEKCGRASDKWLQTFLRKHPNMRDFLMRKQGIPPKRKPESIHSEGDLQSDSSSDFSLSDCSYDSEWLSSDPEPEDKELRTAFSQGSPLSEDAPPSMISSNGVTDSDAAETS